MRHAGCRCCNLLLPWILLWKNNVTRLKEDGSGSPDAKMMGANGLPEKIIVAGRDNF
jgi:hypothetical protein